MSCPSIRDVFAALWRRAACCAWLALACTPLSEFDVQQCTADAECETLLGPAQHCSQSRCVAGCASNRHCSGRDPRFPICPAVGAECVALNSQASACFGSTPYADETMGALTASDLLLIGAFAPGIRSSSWLTLLLAAEELNANGGLPAPDGRLRPLLVLACDDSADSVVQALLHIVHDLKGQAVLAALEQRALAIALGVPETRGAVLYLSPNAVALPAGESGATALWSLGGRNAALARAVATTIARASDGAAARLAAGASAKVALLVSAAREDAELAQAMMEVLELSGRDGDGLMAEDRLRILELADASPTERSAQLREVARFAPDVVAIVAGGTFSDPDRTPRSTVVLDLEGLAAGSGWLPRYVLGPRNASDASLRELAMRDASFRARVLGVTADELPDAEAAGSLSVRFAERYGNLRPGLAPVHAEYDALYLLAYALATAPPAASAAESVELGLRHVTDGDAEPIPVGPGPGRLERVRTLLVEDQPFDTLATSGPARFDPTRHRGGELRAFCWDGTGSLMSVASYASDGTELARNAPVADDCGNEALSASGG